MHHRKLVELAKLWQELDEEEAVLGVACRDGVESQVNLAEALVVAQTEELGQVGQSVVVPCGISGWLHRRARTSCGHCPCVNILVRFGTEQTRQRQHALEHSQERTLVACLLACFCALWWHTAPPKGEAWLGKTDAACNVNICLRTSGGSGVTHRLSFSRARSE